MPENDIVAALKNSKKVQDDIHRIAFSFEPKFPESSPPPKPTSRTPYKKHKKFIRELFRDEVNETQIRALIAWFRNNP